MNRSAQIFLWKSFFSFLQRKPADIAWELKYCASAKFPTSSTDINQKTEIAREENIQPGGWTKPPGDHEKTTGDIQGMNVADLCAHDRRARDSNHFMVIISNTEYVLFNDYFHFN